MSVPPIDSPVASFEVRCRVGQFVMDSDDPDRAPDLVPVGGTVTIEPDLRRPIRVQGENGPRVVGVDPLDFTIDPSTGKLIHPDGEPGVELIDPTDEHLDPQGWTYTANVRPEKGRAWYVTFGAPTDDSGIVDLGSVVSVAPSPGVTENYLQQTITARDLAESFAVRAETAATEAEDWAPEFTWDGTRLVIDGEQGPDLEGPPGKAVEGIGDVPGLQAVIDRLTVGTGWRDISSLIRTSYLDENPNATAHIIRIGRYVTLNFYQGRDATASGVYGNTLLLPDGFRSGAAETRPWGSPGLDQQTGRQVTDGAGIYTDSSGWWISSFAVPGKRYAFTMTFTTPNPWPTNLPGNPV